MKYVVGNLKMNLNSLAERKSYFESFSKEVTLLEGGELEIVLCPPMIHLESFLENIKTNRVTFGAQNIFWEDRGSFTGETSPLAVKNFGAKYAIIGHSERRNLLGESDLVVNAKLKTALKNGLTPIVCIGESEEDRTKGKTNEAIERQLKEALEGIGDNLIGRIMLAYEPIWAIGSGKVPTSDEILSVKILIKKNLAKAYGEVSAQKVKLLYGGSVNSRLVEQVCVDPGMDGVLVGRESLIPRELINIAKNLN